MRTLFPPFSLGNFSIPRNILYSGIKSSKLVTNMDIYIFIILFPEINSYNLKLGFLNTFKLISRRRTLRKTKSVIIGNCFDRLILIIFSFCAVDLRIYIFASKEIDFHLKSQSHCGYEHLDDQNIKIIIESC